MAPIGPQWHNLPQTPLPPMVVRPSAANFNSALSEPDPPLRHGRHERHAGEGQLLIADVQTAEVVVVQALIFCLAFAGD